jgi:hypothetical protein
MSPFSKRKFLRKYTKEKYIKQVERKKIEIIKGRK